MRKKNPRASAVALFLGLGAALSLSHGAAADKIKHSIAVFTGLDKITGRIISFEVGTNETVKFGSLLITDRVCYTRPPTEAPQTDTFVQVDTIDADKKTKRIFSGWMFAASPALNALDHPVYDIWLTDCKGTEQLIHSPPTTAEAMPEPDTNDANAPAAAPRPQQTNEHNAANGHNAAANHHDKVIDVPPPPGFQAPPPDGGDDSQFGAPPPADDRSPPDGGY